MAATWETTFAQLNGPERRLIEVLAWLAKTGSRRAVEGMARYGIQAKRAFGVEGRFVVLYLGAHGIAHGLVTRGAPAAVARAGALGALSAEVQRQASMLAFEKVFLMFGVSFLFAVPLILSLRWRRGARAPAAEAH